MTGYAMPWAPGDVTNPNEHDFTSGDPREWGVDVGLKPGAVVYAPADGTVTAYQPSASDWGPGRLLEAGTPWGTLGFGHVVALVAPGTHVTAGQPIGQVPDQNSPQWDTVMANGGPHVELMLFPRGGQLGRPDIGDPRPLIAQLFGGGATVALGTVSASGGSSADFLGSVKDAAGNIAGGVAGLPGKVLGTATSSVFSGLGSVIGDVFGAGFTDLGLWVKSQAVAFAVAAAVLLVLFSPTLRTSS